MTWYRLLPSPFAISNYHDVNFDMDSTCNMQSFYRECENLRFYFDENQNMTYARCVHTAYISSMIIQNDWNNDINNYHCISSYIYIVLVLHSKGRRNFDNSTFSLKSRSNFVGCRFISECLRCAPMQITVCRFESCETAQEVEHFISFQKLFWWSFDLSSIWIKQTPN